MAEPKTDTLAAPGAVLHYDIRGCARSSEPTLLIIGSPMGADGFVTLAGHFADRTVVTYDPRGSGRSPRTDGALATAVDEHADDLHRLISALNSGPVDIFASSGGAVNALALVARHPEQVQDPGRARAARLRRAAGRRDRAGRLRRYEPDLPAQRVRPGDGEVHRAAQPAGTGSR